MTKVTREGGMNKKAKILKKKKGKKPMRKVEVTETVAEEDEMEETSEKIKEEDFEAPEGIQRESNSGSEENDVESEQDEGEQIAEQFRRNMSNLPLSQVRAMKEKLGIKLFNKAYFGEKSESKKTEALTSPNKKVVTEKRGQHRPKEVSSRKRVSVFRNIYPEAKSKKIWDPRFDERAGTFKEVCFEDNYKFLEDVRKEEKEHLRKNIRDRLEAGEDVSDYSDKLRKLETLERSQKEKRLKSDTMKELRQENIDRLMQGQKPIFKTKAEVRKKIMEKKFEQLKSENRLSKYLEKREKKQSEKLMKQKPESFESKYGYH